MCVCVFFHIHIFIYKINRFCSEQAFNVTAPREFRQNCSMQGTPGNSHLQSHPRTRPPPSLLELSWAITGGGACSTCWTCCPHGFENEVVQKYFSTSICLNKDMYGYTLSYMYCYIHTYSSICLYIHAFTYYIRTYEGTSMYQYVFMHACTCTYMHVLQWYDPPSPTLCICIHGASYMSFISIEVQTFSRKQNACPTSLRNQCW